MARRAASPRLDVRRAVRRVPRAHFLPADYAEFAASDHALPIGWNQTTSQPSLIVHMIELLELEPGHRVLEIGTGSGYQTALLCELQALEVYSIELIPELAGLAAARLAALGYTAAHLSVGDGYRGWPEAAPFNGILVSAAVNHVPPPLVDQLADEGRLVIPIGQPGEEQELWRIHRRGGELHCADVLPVAFVPLVHSPA